MQTVHEYLSRCGGENTPMVIQYSSLLNKMAQSNTIRQ